MASGITVKSGGERHTTTLSAVRIAPGRHKQVIMHRRAQSGCCGNLLFTMYFTNTLNKDSAI
jgi:hypothetical protein